MARQGSANIQAQGEDQGEAQHDALWVGLLHLCVKALGLLAALLYNTYRVPPFPVSPNFTLLSAFLSLQELQEHGGDQSQAPRGSTASRDEKAQWDARHKEEIDAIQKDRKQASGTVGRKGTWSG